jgi:N-acetylated-alpha-linked acidic dipeptidase
VFEAIRDPRRPRVAPRREDVPPHLNFALLDNALDALTNSAQRYQAAVNKQWSAGVSAAAVHDLNRKLVDSERRLTSNEGLLRRPWYRHMIYAPGIYSGYDVKTIPGVREAIEQKRWGEADAEIVRVSKVLDSETQLINSAVDMVSASH